MRRMDFAWWEKCWKDAANSAWRREHCLRVSGSTACLTLANT